MHPVGPDHHQFAAAKLFCVGQCFAHVLGAPGADVGHGAQVFSHRCKCISHGLGVETRRAQNAGLHAQLRLGSPQRLNTGELPAVGSSDHLAGLVSLFGGIVSWLSALLAIFSGLLSLIYLALLAFLLKRDRV